MNILVKILDNIFANTNPATPYVGIRIKDRAKSEIELTFFIAKNRNGSLGRTSYLYNKENQRFYEMRRENGKDQ